MLSDFFNILGPRVECLRKWVLGVSGVIWASLAEEWGEGFLWEDVAGGGWVEGEDGVWLDTIFSKLLYLSMDSLFCFYPPSISTEFLFKHVDIYVL